MQVKKYRASSVKEALDQVKKELGNEALIIETRKVKSKGLKGFFKPALMEVTAVLETPSVQPFLLPRASSDENTKKEIEKLKEMVKSLQAQTALNSINVEEKRSSSGSLEGPLTKIKLKLLNTGMESDSADAIIRELIYEGIDLENATEFNEEIKSVMKKYVKCSSIEAKVKSKIQKPTVVFLVGTTGVGKTTTIAKLAARYHLEENLKVGLITVDTYRIAAVEQLRTYAEIINIPIEVAYNKEEYVKALRRFENMDLIFVDTAGRSQKNLAQIGELREFLSIKKPEEVHLVLNASCRMEDLKAVLAAFIPLGVTHLIYSKVDESKSYGSLFDLIRMTNLPLSYIASGQRVPEDLDLADPDSVIELILEG
ncbi:MAG: hypothetical protein PHD88_06170 [Firmicutes bacterium]|nr:hypothetical protein [Bacillota bacterium]